METRLIRGSQLRYSKVSVQPQSQYQNGSKWAQMGLAGHGWVQMGMDEHERAWISAGWHGLVRIGTDEYLETI